MGRRLDLHEELCKLLGSRNVYNQPPKSIQLEYPCIFYSLDNMPIFHADDTNYVATRQYQIIVVDPNPDSELIDKMAYFPNTRFDRYYVSDNLNHFVFTTYY